MLYLTITFSQNSGFLYCVTGTTVEYSTIHSTGVYRKSKDLCEVSFQLHLKVFVQVKIFTLSKILFQQFEFLPCRLCQLCALGLIGSTRTAGTGDFFEEWNEITPQTYIRKFEIQTA